MGDFFTEAVIIALIGGGAAGLAHVISLITNKSNLTSKAKLREREDIANMLAENRKELNEQRQANLDLRSLQYQVSLENQNLRNEATAMSKEITMLRAELYECRTAMLARLEKETGGN